MRIGELLVKNGLVTVEQLEKALAEQQRNPVKLGELMVAKGYIDERQLAEALEFQLGVPVVNLAEAALSPAVVHLVPESLSRKHGVLPVGRDGGRLRLAMLDPLDQEAIKQIQAVSGLRVLPMLATRTELGDAIARHYGSDESAEELKRILRRGMENKAGCVHLEAAERGLNIRLRPVRASELQDDGHVTKLMQPILVDRIKRMAGLRVEERSIPQSGRFQTDVDHRPVEVHASTLPTLHGESLALRLSDPYSQLLKLSELDFADDQLQAIEKAAGRTDGLMILSGPPGAGITTTAYSLLERKRAEAFKIISIEDPIARVMPGITQTEANGHSCLTTPIALRGALRHQPDVVSIDGLSDAETAETALAASRFGLQIVGTMKARGVFDALGRLMAMVRDADLLASSLACVASQRLARRVCSQCAQTVPATDEEISRFDSASLLSAGDGKKGGRGGPIGNFRSFLFTQVSGKPAVTRGEGCRVCGQTGYRGHVPLHEVLSIDATVREMIAARRPLAEIEKHAMQNGHRSLLQDGMVKAREGLTTVEEALHAVK
ncbi:GspE/PulE family protein [Cohnella suwonensis]|uniref:GspE/PulE family protein n=1 Tax=Cohnella suwonensis TaxID=696072 RepID=A0ABW0LXJ9_9BACL